MTVWITGAGGFSGRHLAAFLRGLPVSLKLIGLGRRGGTNDDLDAFERIDVTDEAALRDLARAQQPDRVFHLAGVLPPAAEDELWRVHVGGTVALLQALAREKKKDLRVLSVGSAAEYLPSAAKFIRESDACGGATPYARTKWAQSAVALACGKELGLNVMVARTFNLLGPGLSHALVAGSLCAQFSRPESEVVKVGRLSAHRDFVDVRDAVRAWWCICEHGHPDEIYNVCRGRATSIRALVRLFSKLAGKRPVVEEEAVRYRRGDFARVCGDNSKLRALGWSPAISLEQSVRDMLERAGHA